MILGQGIKISHAPGQKGKKRENEDGQWSNTTGMVMTGKGITRFDNQEISGELQYRTILLTGSQRTRGSKCKLLEETNRIHSHIMKYYAQDMLDITEHLIKYWLNE